MILILSASLKDCSSKSFSSSAWSVILKDDFFHFELSLIAGLQSCQFKLSYDTGQFIKIDILFSANFQSQVLVQTIISQ